MWGFFSLTLLRESICYWLFKLTGEVPELAIKMYNALASWILFSGGALNLASFGLEYRKGKTIDDLRRACEKGIRAGNAKCEFELSMVELYLKSVLKPVKVKK